MGAPAKFLFDVDFAAGHEREATVALVEHAAKLAEAEAAAHRRGYAEAQSDAAVEAGRRVAGTLERIAASLADATKALAASKRGSNAKRSRSPWPSRASWRRL